MGRIHLAEEEQRKLAHDLKHPNIEALVRRDAFFAAFENEIQISENHTKIAVEVLGLSKDMLEV